MEKRSSFNHRPSRARDSGLSGRLNFFNEGNTDENIKAKGDAVKGALEKLSHEGLERRPVGDNGILDAAAI